jgi:hypothetical protein
LQALTLAQQSAKQQTIRYRIRPDGRVEETVEGLQGSACERLTERIEARLGSVQQRQPTAEAFESAVQTADLATMAVQSQVQS